MELHFSFSVLYVYFKILSVLSANYIVLTIVIAEEIFSVLVLFLWSTLFYSFEKEALLCFNCGKNGLLGVMPFAF